MHTPANVNNEPSPEPPIIWRPSSGRTSRMEQFAEWLGTKQGVSDLADASPSDYSALYQWSITELDNFWGALTEFFGVRFSQQPRQTLGREAMPGAEWFPGATLNYAELALTNGAPQAPGAPGISKADGDVALLFEREDGIKQQYTYRELRDQVAAARQALRALGVQRGDRVAALVPNCPQALIALLATASLGAIWSSCSPDFGAHAVLERFAQIEPRVLIAVDGYPYGGKIFDALATVEELRTQISSVTATVLIGYLDVAPALSPGVHDWGSLLVEHAGAVLQFEAVPFDHPLWILYSSGTTGAPKGIVQGHGGIALEHLKMLALHSDLGPEDRFFWFTTTGWMMWNYLVSGLLVGTTVVLYDGNPGYPSLDRLWELAERLGVTYFGTSAPYVQACRKQGLRPREAHDLSRLRAIGSTGAPLSEDGFAFLLEAVSPTVQIAGLSGGTDICTGFIGPAPLVPVWKGELSCRALGAAIAAFDESGKPLLDEVGELVLTRPLPSMPTQLWNDPDGSRLVESYFAHYPGVWRHGDWIRITERGSCVIYGRSDATIKRGGVRMGTAEFYRVIEGVAEVADSLVIDTPALADGGAAPNGAGAGAGLGQEAVEPQLVCFVVLAPGAELSTVEKLLRGTLRRELSPRHVPDRFVAVPAIPKTLNGKKCEVPVKRILAGVAVEQAISRDALQDPTALDAFIALVQPR